MHRALLMVPVALALGGCFLVSWLPGRGDPVPPVAGPAPYVEGCQGCHAPVAAHYAQSLHTAMGVRCGQCHAPHGHPDFARPVSDATCGGCHQSQYEQTLASIHFPTREQRRLDGDRAARAVLRGERFMAPAPAGGRRFVGDSTSGELGGRLCAACHYDEHRLGLGVVRQEKFCYGCHPAPQERAQHFPAAIPGLANRCLYCHVRTGTTELGQLVNTHRYPREGRRP
jgi:hypothetical protein